MGSAQFWWPKQRIDGPSGRFSRPSTRIREYSLIKTRRKALVSNQRCRERLGACSRIRSALVEAAASVVSSPPEDSLNMARVCQAPPLPVLGFEYDCSRV